jgi:hypothetical protein
MQVSQAKIDANRRNAQMSTGPRTPEGKSRSRSNAITHGLLATTCVPEDAQTMQIRATQVYTALRPQNQFQAWMVDHVALFSMRIDRCERMERRTRDKVALRAELTWDDDRKLEAEIVGGMLASRPAETVETLRRTPHGCEWLMTRWALLAHTADLNEAWTEGQTSLAFDLLATPALFRDIRTLGTSIDFEGKVVERSEKPADIARRMVAELKERREVVAGLDEVERVLAETDHDHDSDPELRRLRRYESMLHNRLRWCVKQITTPSTTNRPAFPGLKPRWFDDSIPTPRLEPRPDYEIAAGQNPPDVFSPPFDLEPDECPPIGQRADIPAILKSRRAKRIAKAEAIRAARRKKVEELRA